MELIISLAKQTLRLESPLESRAYLVSTSPLGAGQNKGSYQTPLGRHYVRCIIGVGAPYNTVFKGRRPTGEIYGPDLAAAYPERDWILTRILWLCGLEVGLNRRGLQDTMQRYIYIHGCPDTELMGVPRSHGCVRMRNGDIIDLCDRIRPGVSVIIRAD